uniref:Uncharacterized protein n=1 Tax=viral metagenome TaxID=1070528 RepID=A0A6C0JBG3_9ZZZZ
MSYISDYHTTNYIHPTISKQKLFVEVQDI